MKKKCIKYAIGCIKPPDHVHMHERDHTGEILEAITVPKMFYFPAYKR